MPLEDLYCLAYAPIQGTCLLDLGEDDFTQETLQKELAFLERFTATSLKAFSKFFKTADVSGAEGAAALYCLSSFFNRLQVVSLRAGNLAGELLNSNKVDYHDALKKLTAKAKKEGLQPEDSRIEDIVEVEKDAQWEVPTAGKGRVEFRHSVSMVSSKGDGSDGSAEVSHQPVKAEFTRKKVRKATGYAKFNFAADDLEDGNKSDTDTETAIPRSQGLAPAVAAPVVPVLKDYRSGAAAKKSDGNPFSLLCCFCPSGELDGSENEVIRRSSSVSLGTVQEIQDKDSDANWHDLERHSGRFARIRGRIPTGHASLMKSSSDDMLDVLLAEDSEEGRRARELLLHNTQLNSSSPPLSPRADTRCSSTAPSNVEPPECSMARDRISGTVNEADVGDTGVKLSENCTGILNILECHITSPS